MSGMFKNAELFDWNLAGWNVSGLPPITNMARTDGMFTGTRLELTRPLDLPLGHTDWTMWRAGRP